MGSQQWERGSLDPLVKEQWQTQQLGQCSSKDSSQNGFPSTKLPAWLLESLVATEDLEGILLLRSKPGC